MTVNMKKGDRLPLLRAELTNSDDVALDLTAATVTFTMRNRATGVVKIATGSVTVISATEGTVQYSWGATDTDTAGTYEGEFIVTIGGLPETVPSSGYVLIVIEPRLS